ncbi:putative cytochrome P450 [Astrocystis sublimbata]|nr:putative cytochrome P450 [Astrocystis sublimbata]
MAYFLTQIIVSVTVLSFFILSRRLLQIGRRPADLPPGPPTIPIMGNLHLIPKHDLHLQFQKWAQEYRPVYSLMMGSKTMIVLSSDNAVRDIMDKRSSILSDRMDLYIGQKVASGGLRLRRIMHDLLNVRASQAFGPYQELENQQMMHDILNGPDNYVSHVRRYSNSLMTTTTFGFEDAHFKVLFKVFDEFLLLAQTGLVALLDYLPILQMLPTWVLPLKQHAITNHRREKALFRHHWDTAKASVLSLEKPNPSFCVGLVQEQKKHEVQARAQAEIDRVVGADRMPLPEDEPKLQYVRGCIKESLRWMPVTILGEMPHALLQEDHYLGYRLPKEAVLVNNVFAIQSDAARYPNPQQFDPDHFRDNKQNFYESAINLDVSQRDQFFFGAGRRICPGIHMADQNLFLGISRLLWAFDFKRPLDNNGNEIVPDFTKVTQGFLAAPLPRDAKRAEVIRNDWNRAKSENLDAETMQWKHSA